MDYCETCDNPLSGGVCLECPRVPWGHKYDCTVEYGVVSPRFPVRFISGGSWGVITAGQRLGYLRYFRPS